MVAELTRWRYRHFRRRFDNCHSFSIGGRAEAILASSPKSRMNSCPENYISHDLMVF